MAVTVVILALEIFGGIVSGSLALLSDAGHVFGDTLAIGIAIIAEHIAIRNPLKKKSARIFGAYINAALIIIISGFIAFEAYWRFMDGKHEILTGPMMAIAVLGAVGNYAQSKILGHGPDNHAGRRAVRLHVFSDLWQSLAVILAGLLIWITGKQVIDPIISLVIATVMLVWVIRLLISIKKSPR